MIREITTVQEAKIIASGQWVVLEFEEDSWPADVVVGMLQKQMYEVGNDVRVELIRSSVRLHVTEVEFSIRSSVRQVDVDDRKGPWILTMDGSGQLFYPPKLSVWWGTKEECLEKFEHILLLRNL